jgi:L-histidine Nalpha-methyltransferase
MPPSAVSQISPVDRSRFAEDVEYYLSLTPRQLPSRYLYDELGSSLFEAICRLPWYGIARAEHHLLKVNGQRIVDLVSPLSTVVELGPGSGTKLSTLLDCVASDRDLTAHLVDISSAALDAATRALERRPRTVVVPHRGTYEAGLAEATRGTLPGGRTLALFLGSNISNFDPPGADAFLQAIRAALTLGDSFLVGVDLVKSPSRLLLAYDDPLGVTSAFNRNLLVRINRELDADFDVPGFSHRAVWNADMSRVEMHLVSERSQRVRIAAAHLDIAFAPGETIWTESSYKYRPDDVTTMLERAGFINVDRWSEDGFSLALATVSEARERERPTPSGAQWVADANG